MNCSRHDVDWAVLHAGVPEQQRDSAILPETPEHILLFLGTEQPDDQYYYFHEVRLQGV